MSCASLMTVKPNGDVEYAEEFHNSTIGAAVLWSEMCKRFLFGGDETKQHEWLHNEETSSKLWALECDMSVPIEWRVCLQFTFDYALCAKHRFENLVAALRAVAPQVNDGYNHLNDYADYINGTMQPDPDCFGVGLHATSTSCDLWKPPNLPSRVRYNIFRDKEHLWLWNEQPVGMTVRPECDFERFKPVITTYENEDGSSRMTFGAIGGGKISVTRETTGCQPLDQIMTTGMSIREALQWMDDHGIEERYWPDGLAEASWKIRIGGED